MCVRCPGGRWHGLESGTIILSEALRTGESPQDSAEGDGVAGSEEQSDGAAGKKPSKEAEVDNRVPSCFAS